MRILNNNWIKVKQLYKSNDQMYDLELSYKIKGQRKTNINFLG